MAKKTDKASVVEPVEANAPADENGSTDALPTTDENTAPESPVSDPNDGVDPVDAEPTTGTAPEPQGEPEAPPTDDVPAIEPPADESANSDASTDELRSDAPALVEVAYHDSSTFTFDLLYAGRRIEFIDGVARVPQTLADDLHAKGYVK
jgi:hypothetical protein